VLYVKLSLFYNKTATLCYKVELKMTFARHVKAWGGGIHILSYAILMLSIGYR